MATAIIFKQENKSKRQVHERYGDTMWMFDDCRVELRDDVLYCYMEDRVQTIVSDDMDKDILELNSGYSPVGDGWEDGVGKKVCYENAIPYKKVF